MPTQILEKLTSASDMVFKTICTGLHGKIILEAILTTIFKEQLIIERYLNVELPKEVIKERGKRLDLLIKTNIGYINIEVNNNDYYKEKIVRNFFYLCEFLVQNVKVGEKYNLEDMYIQLNLNFGEPKNKQVMLNGRVKDEEKVLIENFKIISYSIDKLKEICYNDFRKTSEYKYILMLTMDKDELIDFYPEDEIIIRYGGELVRLNSNADFVRATTNEREQELYVNTVKYESFKDGLKEGIEEEKTETAKKMKENGIADELIVKITGLSKKQIAML